MVIKSRKPLWKNKESVQTQFVEKVVNLEQPWEGGGKRGQIDI